MQKKRHAAPQLGRGATVRLRFRSFFVQRSAILSQLYL